MRDGHTQRLKTSGSAGGIREFLKNYEAKIVAVSGTAAGTEFALDRDVVRIGRGPGVEAAFDSPAMSRQHAAIEYSGEGFRIRDLGSTNGITVNGKPVQSAAIRHGDRMEIGGQEFQLVIEELEQAPEAYELPSV